MSCKKYVDVIAKFDTDGSIKPLAIVWDDGKLYEIDHVIDMRHAVSLKAGGAGIRYRCKIQGREKYIWLEENKWFVEAKSDTISSG